MFADILRSKRSLGKDTYDDDDDGIHDNDNEDDDVNDGDGTRL